MSRSSEKVAFAGLVDGSFTASIPTFSRQYCLYALYALAPFVKILVTEVSATSPAISFGTTELMVASDEPVISHEPITSYTAILWLNSISFFCCTVTGRSQSRTADITFQKRF